MIILTLLGSTAHQQRVFVSLASTKERLVPSRGPAFSFAMTERDDIIRRLMLEHREHQTVYDDDRRRKALFLEATIRIEEQHARGLELAKALVACITAMNPPDRGGISVQEWNQRLKAATKQAAAVFDGHVIVPPDQPKEEPE